MPRKNKRQNTKNKQDNNTDQNDQAEQIESAPDIDKKEEEQILNVEQNNQEVTTEQAVPQNQQNANDKQTPNQDQDNQKHEQKNQIEDIQNTQENDQFEQFNDAQKQKQQDLVSDVQQQTKNGENDIQSPSQQFDQKETSKRISATLNEETHKPQEPQFLGQPSPDSAHDENIKPSSKPNVSLSLHDSEVEHSIETPTQRPLKEVAIVQIQQHEVVLNAQAPLFVEKANDQVMLEGAPQTQLRKQNDEVVLERVQQQKMEVKVEYTNIEVQPKTHIESHQQIELEKQPQIQQQVVVERTETQSQVQVEVQKNKSEIVTEEKSKVQTQNSNDGVYLQQIPVVQLENHQEVSIEQQPRINLESRNLDTQIEKCPQIEIPLNAQSTSLHEHPIVNLEVNHNIHQVHPSPHVQSIQTEQFNSIEQQPNPSVEQKGYALFSVQAPKTEVQVTYTQVNSEPQQQLKVESNQQQTQLIQEEEKVHVQQDDQTHIEVQPSHEIINVEKREVIEHKPQLHTEQNSNPVEVSHNDSVRIEGYHVDQKNNQQKQQKQVPQFVQSPTQQVKDSEPLQPQNDAEQQFLNRSQSENHPSSSKIIQQVPQEVGMLGLSVAAAAGASQFIMKNGVKSKEGLFAALAGSAILYAGYRLFKSKSQQNEKKD
ncbi:unnamed protein product (macronuclear) [Paramecium tetraurelia]|uniref:Uncharacterized protein n=1 Tax=Paramecium tetraurelia TaxID=5888 RepID=A0CAG2_PARTE|nr:uncharacterized protein GSPATT00036559001 [Paramecium tetraurelia]CAK67779.1 unnamed protein product [Paramecium tetraurelia]|eukprot:XP_001435176.1 hypothetical protein (macronuclear) [Paramecium tetraurelia strain d4-2]